MNFSAAELNQISAALAHEAERRKYKHLIDFVRRAWSEIETETYQHNWHIEVICAALEDLYYRNINNLLINVPPGTMKSLLVGVCFHPWVWTMMPEKRFFGASYGSELSIRDAMASRSLIGSDWYQTLWPIEMEPGQDAKTKYQNVLGGWRLATSVGGRGTGEHPDYKLVDDPHNVTEAESDVELKGVAVWNDRTLEMRGKTRNAQTVVVMQRVHEIDLSGHIQSRPNFKKEWTHICLPMRHEVAAHNTFDQRTKPGELLWPSLYDEAKVVSAETNLGTYGAAGQLQQRPAPEGGGILKMTEHIRLWNLKQRGMPDFTYVLQSYDTAFTETTINDPTAAGVFGVFTLGKKNAVLLLDSYDKYVEYPELRTMVTEAWHDEWGGREDKNGRPDMLHPPRRVDQVIIEKKGSGISLIQDLQRAGVPVYAYDPKRKDKVQRAHEVAPILETNCVYVIESEIEPGKPISWARPLIKQCETFPNAAHDDYVDIFTQAMIFFRNERFLELPRTKDDPVDEVDYTKLKHIKRNPYGSRVSR